MLLAAFLALSVNRALPYDIFGNLDTCFPAKSLRCTILTLMGTYLLNTAEALLSQLIDS